MSTKTKRASRAKTAKLPVPPPKGATAITDDPKKAGIPVALQTQNRQPLTPAEQARVDAALAKSSAAKKPAPKSAALQEIEANEKAKRATKRKVATEKKAAVASGATKQMPATGKAAVALINGQAGEVKSATPAAKAAAKAALAKPAAKNGGYDWSKADALASEGKVPPVPPFVSYGPHMAKLNELAKKQDGKGIESYLATFKPGAPRENLRKYGAVCLAAVNTKLVKR